MMIIDFEEIQNYNAYPNMIYFIHHLLYQGQDLNNIHNHVHICLSSQFKNAFSHVTVLKSDIFTFFFLTTQHY